MNLRERRDCSLFSKTSGRIRPKKREDSGIIQGEEGATEIQTAKGAQGAGEDSEKNEMIRQDRMAENGHQGRGDHERCGTLKSCFS